MCGFVIYVLVRVHLRVHECVCKCECECVPHENPGSVSESSVDKVEGVVGIGLDRVKATVSSRMSWSVCWYESNTLPQLYSTLQCTHR